MVLTGDDTTPLALDTASRNQNEVAFKQKADELLSLSYYFG